MRSDVAETGIGQLDWTARKIGHYRDAINPFVREFRFFLSEKKRETEREGGEGEIKKSHRAFARCDSFVDRFDRG